MDQLQSKTSSVHLLQFEELTQQDILEILDSAIGVKVGASANIVRFVLARTALMNNSSFCDSVKVNSRVDSIQQHVIASCASRNYPHSEAPISSTIHQNSFSSKQKITGPKMLRFYSHLKQFREMTVSRLESSRQSIHGSFSAWFQRCHDKRHRSNANDIRHALHYTSEILGLLRPRIQENLNYRQ